MPFLGCMTAGFAGLYLLLPPVPRLVPTAADARLDAVRALVVADTHVQAARWRVIVIHHSGTVGGNAERFDEYHRYERGWAGGLGYHFVVGNGNGSGDGQIQVGPHWVKQEDGVHVRGHNPGAIGICLVGDFEKTAPTPAQMQALSDLVRVLMALTGLRAADVKVHSDFVDTLCPGQHFPKEAFLKGLPAR